MNYGSSLVYVYSDSEEEYVSEVELEEGMWLSCSSGEEDQVSSPPSSAAQQTSPHQKKPPSKKTSSRTPKKTPPYRLRLSDDSFSSGSDTGTDTDTEDNDLDLAFGDASKGNVKVASGSSPSRKGRIKNRLSGQKVRRMKKTRVKWDETAEKQQSKRGRRVRRSDTNIIAVKFNTLAQPSDVHTGDPVVCGNKRCAAILSHFTTLLQQDGKENKLWVCEFCGKENQVEMDMEEVPIKKDTTYMLAPPPPVDDKDSDKGATAAVGVGESSLIIFCVDVSGSMNTMSQASGSRYVSRLQVVQAAVDYQLSDLIKSHPKLRVALITFSNMVNVIGDGSGETVSFGDRMLNDLKSIMVTGEDMVLPGLVEETGLTLAKKVASLSAGGGTALGPALLLSISWAASVPGSKVIICTDGLANKGVGALSGLGSTVDRAEAQTFYEDMGTLAKEKNVTVSLVRIKGTDCKALELGQVADKTGGQVTTVDPLNITKEFSSILANPVIATNVTTRIVLHGQLYFRTEESKESVREIPVGSVMATTELTYEYGVRKKPKKSSTSPPEGAAVATDTKTPPTLQLDGKPHLPFQLQVEYTSKDGSRLMRVITDANPITRDRGMAEKDIHMNVVGTHVAQRTAELAMEGEYTTARLAALTNQRLLARSSHASSDRRGDYESVMEDIIPLENALMAKQKTERATTGRQLSEDEGEEEEFFHKESSLMGAARDLKSKSAGAAAPPPPKPASAPKKKKAISRRKDINDELATYCYNMKTQQY